jgi:hypothetical protein
MNRKAVLLGTLAVLMIASCITLAHATTYTYDVKQVTMSMMGNPMTFQATTDDPNVKQVTFTWYNPSGSEVRKQVVKGSSPFEDTFVPDQEGTWFIRIEFQDANGNLVNSVSHEEDVSPNPYGIIFEVNTIPEVPVLGTVGASVAMVLGLAYKMKRKAQR